MLKKFLIGLWFAILGFGIQKSFSQNEVFWLKNKLKEPQSLNSQLWLLADSTKLLKLDSAKQSSQFRPYADLKDKINPEMTYWGRIRLRNEDRNVLSGILILSGRYLNFAEVYILTDDGNINFKKTGNLVKLSEKEIKQDRNTAKISLDMNPREAVDVYIRFWNIDKKLPSLDLQFWQKDVWYAQYYEQKGIQLFFQGIFWFIFVSNLLTYLSVRLRVFLAYAIYLFSLILYFLNFHGLTLEYFFPENPHWFYYVYVVATSGVGFAYLIFVRLFLQTAKNAFWLDKIIRYALFLRAIEVLIMFGVLLYSFDYEWVHYVHRTYALFESAFSILLLVLLVRLEDKTMVAYIGFGNLSLQIGLIISIAFSNWAWSPYAYQVGALVEVFAFSLGLAHQMRRREVDKRRAQEQLVVQLRRNEEIQAQFTEELEEKVKLRTEEYLREKQQAEMLNQELQSTIGIVFKHRDKIQTQNKRITDSINYAKRIQNAILTKKEWIRERYFDDFFIIYRPKDIVSGDFYWFAEKPDKILFAVVDCTGHGVAGAFMSMIANELLNRIVHDKEIHEPHLILQKINVLLRASMRQSETDMQDGMDICICSFFKNEANYGYTSLQYAGSMIPLWYVRRQAMHEIKADKIWISGQISPKHTNIEYQVHTLLLDEALTLYFFTDGFADQFGGTNNKRIGKKMLQQILLEIQDKPLVEQKNYLEDFLTNWQKLGREAQTDDITLIGIRFE